MRAVTAIATSPSACSSSRRAARATTSSRPARRSAGGSRSGSTRASPTLRSPRHRRRPPDPRGTPSAVRVDDDTAGERRRLDERPHGVCLRIVGFVARPSRTEGIDRPICGAARGDLVREGPGTGAVDGIAGRSPVGSLLVMAHCLVAEDTALSRRRHGFESRMGLEALHAGSAANPAPCGVSASVQEETALRALRPFVTEKPGVLRP